jgi:hypothetical protein
MAASSSRFAALPAVCCNPVVGLPYSSNCDVGSTEWAKTSVRRAGVYAGACDINVKGNLGPAHYCHCEDCRRCTGSINVAVQVEARSFRIIAGSPRGFTKKADSSNFLTRYFCPECGSSHMSAFGSKADMTIAACLLLGSLLGVKRTWLVAAHMSASDPKRTLATAQLC